MGAGPAGSTTAKYCAHRGADVLVIDRRKEIGHPVQCGELLPHAKEMYSMFPRGIELEELFDIDHSTVDGESDTIEMISPRGRAYRIPFSSHVLNRRSFDKRLAKGAEEAGARVMTGTSLLSVDESGVAETTAGQIKAKVVVGADGPNSRTAREAGLERPRPSYPAIACRTDSTFGSEVRMFFGAAAPGGYAWVIPKDRGANIGVGYSQAMCSAKPTELLKAFASWLGVSVREEALGFVPLAGPSRRTTSGRFVLVGDAAGHTMASNGGGIPTAMIAGREAGRVIRRHLEEGAPLSDYELAWRAFMEGPLIRSHKTLRLAGYAFRNDALTGLAMAMLGRRGLDRAIRCRRLFL
ncbi:MAG: geranylgeranyl reductase family protein [Methanobacteriota archaeon]|nr:MAG: geranylgeranyl reductase family protein [Euryarchaeota archaeon]